MVNDPESALLLLSEGAQLEALDDTGRTPLALAASYGNLETWDNNRNPGVRRLFHAKTDSKRQAKAHRTCG